MATINEVIERVTRLRPVEARSPPVSALCIPSSIMKKER